MYTKPSKQELSEIRCGIYGEDGCGKSSLMIRYVDNMYRDSAGVKVERKLTNIEIEGAEIKFSIWGRSTSQKGRYSINEIKASETISLDAIILCFDISDRASYESACGFLKGMAMGDPRLVANVTLLATKIDLAEADSSCRQVSKEEAQAFAEQHGLTYFEVSAKTGDNVEAAFTQIAVDVYNAAVKRTPTIQALRVNDKLSPQEKLEFCTDANMVRDLMLLVKRMKDEPQWQALMKEMGEQIKAAPSTSRQDLIDKYRQALRVHHDADAGSLKFRLLHPLGAEPDTYRRIEKLDKKRPKEPAYTGWKKKV